MNKLMMVAGAVLIAVAITGCATVDPLTIEQTARDRQVHEPTIKKPVHEGQYRIAVVSRMNEKSRADRSKADDELKRIEQEAKMYVAAAQKFKAEKDPKAEGALRKAMEKKRFLEGAKTAVANLDTMAKKVTENVESAIVENFSNLGWFETVDRKNGMAISNEAKISGDDVEDLSKYPNADLLLIADSSSVGKKGGGTCLETDFRLIDLKTRQPVLAEKIVSSDDRETAPSMDDRIRVMAKKSVKNFAKIVSARYLPDVEVLQTRGDGRYAQVAMGKNYQATPGARVDFFTVTKRTVAGKETLDDEVFAHGNVIRAEKAKSWVEVDNYEAAGVMKGHFAKMSEEVAASDEDPE